MHSSLLTISATLALCLSVASANPFPVGGGAPLCQDQYAYIITNQWNDHGTPVVGTQTIAAGDGNNQLTSESSYSTGVCIEGGISFEMDFEELASTAGISASVTVSTESGTAEGVSMSCPGPGQWHCALIVWPGVTKVTGSRQLKNPESCEPIAPGDPYTAVFPTAEDNHLTGASYDVCACQNYEHWADNGAPSIVCPQPCT